MVDLPPEILTGILSLLPAQSLLRFRSTSKSLQSLIDSHNFIKLHLQNFLNRSLILRHNFDFYQIEDFSNLTTGVKLNIPFTGPINRMSLLGSCNGLLCISSNAGIAFWNPNIRKHRIIPFPPIPTPQHHESNNNIYVGFCIHGFGFDPLTNDYKLIRISCFVGVQHSTFESHVRLFSFKTNSWKELPTMPYTLSYARRTMGDFVENSLHWVMTRKLDLLQPRAIVAFNLTLEIFNEVPFPEIGEDVNSESFQIGISVLEGCLCMIVNYQTAKIDVWVMKEYGCRDSWCKLFTLAESCFSLPLRALRILGYSSDRSMVLLQVDREKLFWYDLKSECVSYVEGIPRVDHAIICVGSLVQPSFPRKENQTSKRRYFLLIT
ncbi:putative F-box domain-containing protein [Medicago truncatula]|uniref:F-box protein interaction domain protein n=1 Tax=Medicago truncatula TaxID=3880 RepID=A0A072VKS9_MEDTR|nr:F-box protein interaction domain protein [Medicago truncatula]RHN79903.1 putative F-box domain-containing protein [Medicago truncatula]